YSSTRAKVDDRGVSVGPIEIETANLALDDDEIDLELAKGAVAQEDDVLPRHLSSELLTQWRVPSQYHPVLASCRTSDDLLELTIELTVVQHVLDLLYPPSVVEARDTAQFVVSGADQLAAYAVGTITRLLLHLDEEQ